MSDNFLRSRRDSCEHAFNREIAETTNDTARTTCCSIDEFLSECFITGTGFRWFLTRNLSSDGTSRSIAIDYRCLTRSVQEKALILFLSLCCGVDIIARLTRIDRLVFSDGTIGLFTFELLWHLNGSIAMTSPPSFYYRYSFRYRRDLLKNQTIYTTRYITKTAMNFNFDFEKNILFRESPTNNKV